MVNYCTGTVRRGIIERKRIILLSRLMVPPSMGNTLEPMIFPLLIPHIVLGFGMYFPGCAQSTLDTLVEILDDLDVVRSEIGETAVSAKILSKMKNTMSDRHAAEKLFTQILAEYRCNILPDVVAGWEQMTDAEHEQLMRMNNFFCKCTTVLRFVDNDWTIQQRVCRLMLLAKSMTGEEVARQLITAGICG